MINKKFRFAEDHFAKSDQGINKIQHEVLLLMKCLQTQPQIEDMNIKLQSLKGETKLKFYKNINKYYDEMNNKNFQCEEDILLKMRKVLARYIMRYYY